MRFLAVVVLLLVSACSSTWQFSTLEQIRLTHLAEQLCPETEGLDPLCNIPMALNTSNFTNAYATYVNIQITRSLLQMMSDGELAYTLAHEIGHKALHINVNRSVPYEVGEIEADRFAQYVTYCHGFDPFAGITSLNKLMNGLSDETKDFMKERIKLMKSFNPSEINCHE